MDELSQTEANRVRVKVDRLSEAAAFLKTQSWIDSVGSNINELTVFVQYSQIPRMVQLLTDNGFKIYAVNPVQTLEDYFFSIVEQGRLKKETGN